MGKKVEENCKRWQDISKRLSSGVSIGFGK